MADAPSYSLDLVADKQVYTLATGGSRDVALQWAVVLQDTISGDRQARPSMDLAKRGGVSGAPVIQADDIFGGGGGGGSHTTTSMHSSGGGRGSGGAAGGGGVLGMSTSVETTGGGTSGKHLIRGDGGAFGGDDDDDRDITVYKRGNVVVAFGRLLKKGEGMKIGGALRIGRGGYKDRFFFLDGNMVRYYYDEADFDLDQLEGSLLFQLGWWMMDAVRDVRPASFGKGDKNFGLEVVTDSRTYVLAAHNEATRSAWVKVSERASELAGSRGEGRQGGEGRSKENKENKEKEDGWRRYKKKQNGKGGGKAGYTCVLSPGLLYSLTPVPFPVARAPLFVFAFALFRASGIRPLPLSPSLPLSLPPPLSLTHTKVLKEAMKTSQVPKAAQQEKLRESFFAGCMHRGELRLLTSPSALGGASSRETARMGAAAATEAMERNGGEMSPLCACLTARQFLMAVTDDDLCGIGDKVVVAVDVVDIAAVSSGSSGGEGGAHTIRIRLAVAGEGGGEDGGAGDGRGAGDAGAARARRGTQGYSSAPTFVVVEAESSKLAREWMRALCAVTKRLELTEVTGAPGTFKSVPAGSSSSRSGSADSTGSGGAAGSGTAAGEQDNDDNRTDSGLIRRYSAFQGQKAKLASRRRQSNLKGGLTGGGGGGGGGKMDTVADIEEDGNDD